MQHRLPSLAKIIRPSLSAIFPRERLFSLLDENIGKPVTYISGPPGCGKTTLISSYLETRKLRNLWYQVDNSDEDIASFFYHIGLAARKATPRRRKPFPLFTPEYLPDLPTFTHCFFQELYSRLKAPFILVFDNYQEVGRESQFHNVIADGLALIPKGVTVAIVSRSDPPTALVKMVANDQMRIINRNSMKLTDDEVKGIVELRKKRKIADRKVEELHKKTEGWAAGVVLMLEKSETDGHTLETAGEFSPESIFDYFAGEVFHKTDRHTQELLLKTAFMPAVTTTMAAQLTGLSQAGMILAGLCRKNYFTVKHHRSDPVYQYHPLFKDFLLSLAGETFEPELLVQVQQKAAEIMEKNGQISEAIGLLRDAGEWEAAAGTIIKYAPLYLDRGMGQTLEQWLKDIIVILDNIISFKRYFKEDYFIRTA